MKAMVLAAGLGTRLRPYTDFIPKPLFPVLGIPLIEWVLASLREAGVREVIVNLHHLPASIVRRLGNGSALGLRIEYSDEPILLGTGGGLWAVRDFFRFEESFFVHNADVFTTFDLRALLEHHRATKAHATLAITKDPAQPEAHVVEVEEGLVVGIRGRPRLGQGRFVFTGISVQTEAIFEALPEGAISCLVADGLVPMLESGKRVAGIDLPGLFCDAGDPKRFLELQWELLESDPAQVFLLRGMEPPVEVEKGVFALGRPDIRPGAHLEPPVFLCGNCRIEAFARVGPRAVICDGAKVLEGVEVRDALLFPGVTVTSPCQGIVVSGP